VGRGRTEGHEQPGHIRTNLLLERYRAPPFRVRTRGFTSRVELVPDRERVIRGLEVILFRAGGK
jgi:hypothetical protein